MKLWIVNRFNYIGHDAPTYTVSEYNLFEYLKCCLKFYGFAGLKWAYLSKKRAWKKAAKLNTEARKR